MTELCSAYIYICTHTSLFQLGFPCFSGPVSLPICSGYYALPLKWLHFNVEEAIFVQSPLGQGISVLGERFLLKGKNKMVEGDLGTLQDET